jgi:transcriptional regulator with XRE-family HTH domain
LKRNSRQTPHPQPALGKAIRELRSKRDVSLENLAPRAGLALNTLSLIERGQANPTWETVKGIAAALDVSIADLAKLSLKFEDSPPKMRPG